MLTIEITNDESYPAEERLGIARRGNYDYVVRVGREEIARGRIAHHERKHFSLLLAAVAEDARQSEMAHVLNVLDLE